MFGEAQVINFKMLCRAKAYYEIQEVFYRIQQAFTETHPLFSETIVSVADPELSEDEDDGQTWVYPVSVKVLVEGDTVDAEVMLAEQINPMLEELPPELSNMVLQILDIKAEKILHLPKIKSQA